MDLVPDFLWISAYTITEFAKVTGLFPVGGTSFSCELLLQRERRVKLTREIYLMRGSVGAQAGLIFFTHSPEFFLDIRGGLVLWYPLWPAAAWYIFET